MNRSAIRVSPHPAPRRCQGTTLECSRHFVARFLDGNAVIPHPAFEPVPMGGRGDHDGTFILAEGVSHEAFQAVEKHGVVSIDLDDVVAGDISPQKIWPTRGRVATAPYDAASFLQICADVRTRAIRGKTRRMSWSWLSCSGEVHASEAITRL